MLVIRRVPGSVAMSHRAWGMHTIGIVAPARPGR